MTQDGTSILLATNNPHKVEELTDILAPLGVRLLTIGDVPEAAALEEPNENGKTFEENAQIKATAYAEATGMLCLADDSGLEVDALSGAPGVRSARYAGIGFDRAERDAANNAKLLAELISVPNDRRSARFVCAMCLAGPDGAPLASARGTFEGCIGHEPKGSRGFGYDPLFVIDDPDDPLQGKHAAELTPEQKHERSHRGDAARQIADRIKDILAAT
jgi:XTP/dITP diphosphohydrolase